MDFRAFLQEGNKAVVLGFLPCSTVPPIPKQPVNTYPSSFIIQNPIKLRKFADLFQVCSQLQDTPFIRSLTRPTFSPNEVVV